MIRRALASAAAVFLLSTVSASAQAPGFSQGAWKRVETEHFLFLYPEELSDWTLSVARRMEAVHAAVTSFIGWVPEDRATVLVDDPGNVSNGSTNPGPLLYVWPTPPDARSMVGENRGWGEILAVHEFAHAVHLTRPSRNPVQRFLWRLAPIPLTPLMLETPRWVAEGYATYVEGMLTGSGRPHGVWRPAVLRTWALEGQLPTYDAVSGTRGYLGGAMAYLMGSAYLEWLVDREGRGSDTLQDLWARMTARERRSFSQAFKGVFGAPPDELYGFFTVEVTERALEVRTAVEAAGGVVDGNLFQRLSWSTGDPAVSPDGNHLALALASEESPTRIVVMSSSPDTVSTREKEHQAEILRKDPEDVAPVRRIPRAQRHEATLWPDFGHAYGKPRWLPDGRGILVTRDVEVQNQRLRPELFLWEWETGVVRQITRGEAIREADPASDGSWAAGLRCLEGTCDIVRVDLGSGAVSTLASSDLLSPYAHPRLSPDSRTIVASRHVNGDWRLVAMDSDGSHERFLGPDDGAARFDAEFLPDGRRLVLSSSRGGVPNLELLDLASGRILPLTRVLGAAAAPAPPPEPGGPIFFLSLHSRGWDLRRIAPEDAAGLLPWVNPRLAPAAVVGTQEEPSFSAGPLGPVRGYGLGPRLFSYFPMVSFAEEGNGGGIALTRTDPIGRFTWQLRGMYGSEGSWRGGSFDLLWRGTHPWIGLDGFLVDGPLPRHPDAPQPERERSLTKGYYGGTASLRLEQVRDRRGIGVRFGGSAGRMESAHRALGFGSLALDARQSPSNWLIREALELTGSAGRTGDLDWKRWTATGTVTLGMDAGRLRVSGSLGRTDAPAASPEAFQIGGTEPFLFDPLLLTQRITMPALPSGFLRGKGFRTVRADLEDAELLNLFIWAGDADGDALGWYRIAGTEISATSSPLPYLRIPSATLRLGSAYTLDHPDRGAWRWWLILGFRP